MTSEKNSGKKIMNMIYGIGASVVILGALFKLMHWPGGNAMLIIGLLTEASIFFISAFEKPEKEVDWSLVYPQLREYDYYEDEEAYYEEDDSDPISAKLDELFKAANIDSSLLKGLSGSLENLTRTASSISNAVEVSDYNRAYTQEISNATESVRTLNNFYQSQIESSNLQGQYNQEVLDANREVLDATGKVKEEMDALASNLSSLNSVYGNMLTAMRG